VALTIHEVVTGRWLENCYVVHAGRGEAVIIDPGADLDRIEACVNQAEVEVKAILLTHGHFDHIGAAEGLRSRYGVPCFLHQADHKLVRSVNFYRSIFESKQPIEVPQVDALPESDTPLTLAGLSIEPIHTPGHTRGGVCYRIDDELFTGDTLHRGRAGRVDLPGGSAEHLAASLHHLSTLPADIRVHPGHGETTSIGAELSGTPAAGVTVS
jgi:glyoxylase-like metal-dependent hydrolase (beta-lactamase superfamily II)